MKNKQFDRNKYKYEFDRKTGILFKYYYGEISIYDITSSWEYAIEHKMIPAETKAFILDYRKASFHLKDGEYVEIPKFYREHLEVFGNSKIAILTENYRDIVIPVLVEQEDQGYSSKPFTTREAAIRWVLI